MSALLNYFYAESEKKAAYHQYCYTGQLLKNKEIECRFAEIKSQHDPLAKIIGDDPNYNILRQKLIDACFYVVVGRLPDNYRNIKEEG